MDTAKIKSYAPKARQQFIEAIARQAALLGITEQGIAPIEIKGDVALIDGKLYPATIAQQRRGLERQIEQQGYQQVIEKIAYSWFNRLVALRYMELHNYLDHGRRVLSHPEQENAYQILEECADIEMDGLDRAKVIELKLAGDKDEELYRRLLLAQCHQLYQSMGFLFEAVDDASELLLPHNLTKTDSAIRQLVNAIPEELWQNVEIIGWLYQFYISEKKDQVIGKVVKSEDIPAATQLFTPNWIVKYLVQNSIGRQWLMTYPDSPLKGQMEYYIEPAKQTDEVQAQLKKITPASIDPQTLKVLDPACGSGHILVEAYDLLKAIYAERGYRSRDIPKLILENNLYGLDIDDRAAQLAGFALLMKARADDRRIFTRNINFNVLSLQSSEHLNPLKLWNDINLRGQWQKEQTDELFGSAQGELSEPQNDADYQLIADLIERFQQAKTFGSLIDVPHENQAAIEVLHEKLHELSEQGDTRQKPAANSLLPIFHQALLLAQRYDAVVANPPYMGGKGMNADLKAFAKKQYPNSKADLFSVSTERFLKFVKPKGFIGLMTPFTWMFLKSFESLRYQFLESKTLHSLIQPEYHAFFDSAYVPVCTFIIQNCHTSRYVASFIKLEGFYGAELQPKKTLEAIDNPDCGWLYRSEPDEFKKIPGSPIAYWIRNTRPFDGPSIANEFESGGRTKTHDNDKYLRFWWEVVVESDIWMPYANGGDFRKYAGNDLQVVNWSRDATSFYESHGGLYPRKYWGKEGITWGLITSARTSFRIKPNSAHYSSGAPTIFSGSFHCGKVALGFLNSPIAYYYLKAMNPTLNTTVNDVLGLPLPDQKTFSVVDETIEKCISLSRQDWNAYEHTRDFQSLPILIVSSDFSRTIESSYMAWVTQNRITIAEMKCLEEENNALFINAYDLKEELSPEVPIKQVTLTVNPAYRYGGDASYEVLAQRFQSDTLSELTSYSIGCMMGRYSLDREGLVYAHSGNDGFAGLASEGAYNTFPADDDGIIPLTDQHWFDDDATNRFRNFVKTVWGEEQLQENLDFVAQSLCLHAIKAKRGEDSLQTIRRYLSSQFYKDHLKTYKKRPIYWLFSSGKQKAFECLVYLHRYNAGTLARMRTEYVIPLTSKLNSHVEKLEQDKENSESASEVKKIEKELQTLHKKQAELSTFDEKLRHCADQRIELDLDDGVKVNYDKFGDLLAEVKAVTGKKK